MESTAYLRTLYPKLANGTLTEAELDWLLAYFDAGSPEALYALVRAELVLPDAPGKPSTVAEAEALRRVHDQIEQAIGSLPTPVHTGIWMRRLIPYAAAVILVAFTAIWFLRDNPVGIQQPVDANVQDIKPGGHRATLTLADGRVIDLSESQSGIVIADEITYLDGTSIADGRKQKMDTHQMVLSTPKGGTYQITLPDGSKVWLNAQSTLKYPSRFVGNERVVYLDGEGYFDVAERQDTYNKRIPFKVITDSQTIEVLGTEFNVSAFPDEQQTKTTLVKGSVRLSLVSHPKSIVLLPGQQSVLSGSTFDTRNVNTYQYTAWREGYFFFKRTPLEDVLRQVCRWYDVEVEYRNGIPNDIFGGQIKRDVTLLGLIEILQVSNIDITLEGRVLKVN
ncbi:FecR family protein [Parapedobacter indicus]|uniref:FecR family protein n=1 Tax=Parapedobacter indicus TaxID=1477437 RepID=A0A1I3M509_9SPHI|nr:FecR family protein [Parapedobacter indicus]PPL01284.1 FecR family protein [Parapedobacter indicus]SFI91825.1 FecR family protein [Parapedobacter indicus]